MVENSELNDQLRDQIRELKDICNRIAFVGRIVFTTTLLMIANCAALILATRFYRLPMYIPVYTLLAALGFFVTLLYLNRYDRLKKRGRVIYEEVSDELQWHIAGNVQERSSESVGGPPNIKARIALRSFIYDTELPLVPFAGGPLIYFGITCLLLLGTVYLEATTKW